MFRVYVSLKNKLFRLGFDTYNHDALVCDSVQAERLIDEVDSVEVRNLSTDTIDDPDKDVLVLKNIAKATENKKTLAYNKVEEWSNNNHFVVVSGNNQSPLLYNPKLSIAEV